MTLPLVFPIATYSLPAEKSTLVTVPSGVPDVGQLANVVNEGRWTYRFNIVDKESSVKMNKIKGTYHLELVFLCLAGDRHDLSARVEPDR